MDPDACLAEIRDIINNQRLEVPAVAERLAELTQSLDEWLTGGGFLPAPWTPALFPATRRVINLGGS